MAADIKQAEYESLRAEILATIHEIWGLERYVLLATAAVWTWLATHPAGVPRLAWYVPFMLAAYGVIRSGALWWNVSIIATFLRQYREPPAGARIGWETFRADKNSTVIAATAFYWLALIVATWIGGSQLSQPPSTVPTRLPECTLALPPTAVVYLNASFSGVATLTKSFTCLGSLVALVVDKTIIGAIVLILTVWLSERVVRVVAWWGYEKTAGAWFRLTPPVQYGVSGSTGFLVGGVVAWFSVAEPATRCARLWPIAIGIATGLYQGYRRVDDGRRIATLT